jgi:Ca-activated chloride channel family protein
MKTLQVLIFSIIFSSLVSFGQTVDDYYHQAAQLYIGGKFNDAIMAIDRGLEIDPNDARLQALLDKIKQEQEQQQQQQQQQEQQQAQQNEEQNQQQQQEQEQQQQEQQQAQQQNQNGEQQEEGEQPEQQLAEAQGEEKELSKEEAERILEALRSKEKENKDLRRPRQTGKTQVDKDW